MLHIISSAVLLAGAWEVSGIARVIYFPTHVRECTRSAGRAAPVSTFQFDNP